MDAPGEGSLLDPLLGFGGNLSHWWKTPRLWWKPARSQRSDLPIATLSQNRSFVARLIENSYGEIDKGALRLVWAEETVLVGSRLGLVLELNINSTFHTCKKECMLVQVHCNLHEDS